VRAVFVNVTTVLETPSEVEPQVVAGEIVSV
jgi:hypothetical protein